MLPFWVFWCQASTGLLKKNTKTSPCAPSSMSGTGGAWIERNAQFAIYKNYAKKSKKNHYISLCSSGTFPFICKLSHLEEPPPMTHIEESIVDLNLLQARCVRWRL